MASHEQIIGGGKKGDKKNPSPLALEVEEDLRVEAEGPSEEGDPPEHLVQHLHPHRVPRRHRRRSPSPLPPSLHPSSAVALGFRILPPTTTCLLRSNSLLSPAEFIARGKRSHRPIAFLTWLGGWRRRGLVGNRHRGCGLFTVLPCPCPD